MSGHKGVALVSENVAATETLIQLVAAVNHAIRITEASIGFQGTSTTAEPIKCELIRQTSAGTSVALTIREADDANSDTFDTIALQDFTAEPTDAGDIIRSWNVHPQTGVIYPPPERDDIMLAAGGRIGLRVVGPGAAVDVEAYIAFEE